MSYKSMPMWTVVCDDCGDVFEDEEEGFIAWQTKGGAEERAEGREWYCREGEHYCNEHGPEGRFLIDDIAEGRHWPNKGGAS